MHSWSLATILSKLHDDIHTRLRTARDSLVHPGTKGDASEAAWLRLLQEYLPIRYQAASAHVVGSLGQFSAQINVVVFDRQYSPFIFKFEGAKIIPAESVYAVFEAKQDASAPNIGYARKKIRSVRRLHRTSLPVPNIYGTAKPKDLNHILGGLLALDSNWRPPLGPSLRHALEPGDELERLDLGYIATDGYFFRQEGEAPGYPVVEGRKPATAFLFRLTSLLQSSATVPMIDVEAYAGWLDR